jgi:3-methyladenine DNA glycosylase AlkD
MQAMIVDKSWWDTVDLIASNLAGMWLLDRTAAQRKQIALQWAKDKHLWLNRTAIIFQLKYKTQTDTTLMFRIMEMHAGSKEFFIQKAIGWALRQYARTDAATVRAFVQAVPLKPLSVREALKHIG